MEQMESIFICNLTEEGQTHSIYYLICLSSFSCLMFEEEKYHKRFTKHADFFTEKETLSRGHFFHMMSKP